MPKSVVAEVTEMMLAMAGQGHLAGIESSDEAREFFYALERFINHINYERNRDHEGD